jgi:hypothetical protein
VFNPPAVKIRLGGVVTWTWASSGHSVTDSSGLDLFDSGVLASGSIFSYTIFASGKCRYASTPDPGMTGTVNCRSGSTHPWGTATRAFGSGGATTAPPSTHIAYLVEGKLKKAPRWGGFNNGPELSLTRTFSHGTWEFRARMQDFDTGQHTAWSPISKLVVTRSTTSLGRTRA